MKNRNRKPGQGAKLLLAGATLAAIVALPITAGAANLSNTPFAVKATNTAETKYFGIRPFLKGTSPTTEPTTPPTTTPPAADPTDLTPRTVAMTIDTRLPGCVPSNFSLEVYGSIDFMPKASINWGDGSAASPATNGGAYKHSYTTPGRYDLTVDGTLQGLYRSGTNELSGNIDTTGANECILSVDHIGSETGMTTMSRMLLNAKNIQHVAAPPKSVTDLTALFEGASNYNEDISGWDTSNVTSMKKMFFKADAFNQPIGKWNTGKVSNFEGMFYYAKSFNQPLNSWNTSSGVQMAAIFHGASNFNQDLNGWDTSKAQNMSLIFAENPKFTGNISSWNTSSATSMSGMFYKASAFNGDISNWNTSKVKNFGTMFWDATSFNQPIGKWNTTAATQVVQMFVGASVFNQDLSSWDFRNIVAREKANFASNPPLDTAYAPKGITLD